MKGVIDSLNKDHFNEFLAQTKLEMLTLEPEFMKVPPPLSSGKSIELCNIPRLSTHFL